ncbi:hypothetical protein GFO_2675 [Christiangramia forsetii KT0803]|uniref:Uncharacterized protein n=1 Tax=Christiangramia forsetii (strain DSM 17595 / CGMCC 1.15422 / KT0803) TaxID=411154 RepID=A0M4T6_CHRFK|nr:hypothetical protein GFO_2675 [Christiangramia forsetii KT0803]
MLIFDGFFIYVNLIRFFITVSGWVRRILLILTSFSVIIFNWSSHNIKFLS